ncbi:MAG: hypothetical protein D6698_06845 [Gammaproteobacteria bacterium]|nr:MAG: hypothetical protein D6698_06845 [Gammaproteobacteria bacterium]
MTEKSGMSLVVTNVGVVASDLPTVPDLETGGERTHRFGCWLSLNIFPDLHKQQQSPNQSAIVLPTPPTVLITADSLEDLEERLVTEIKELIKHADNTLREAREQGQGLPAEEK